MEDILSKKLLRRFLSVLIVFALLLSTMPYMAFADNESEGNNLNHEQNLLDSDGVGEALNIELNNEENNNLNNNKDNENLEPSENNNLDLENFPTLVPNNDVGLIGSINQIIPQSLSLLNSSYSTTIFLVAGEGLTNEDIKDAEVILTNNNGEFFNAEGNVVTDNYKFTGSSSYTYSNLSGAYNYEVTLEGCYVAKGSFNSSEVVKILLNEELKNSSEVDWAGAYNHQNGNAVVNRSIPTSSENIYEDWKVKIGSPDDWYMGYYAGQTAIFDGYLYITSGEKLHKIDIEDGSIDKSVDSSYVMPQGAYYLDNLVYGDGIIFVAGPNCISAYDADDLDFLWRTIDYGYENNYRPIVYQDGYVYCGKYSFKTTSFEVDENNYNLPVWTIDDDFSWNSGVVVGDYYYVTADTTIYAVNIESGEILDSFDFVTDGSVYNQSGLAYNEGALYWGSKNDDSDGYLYKITLDENGNFEDSNFMSQEASQGTNTTPVIYNDRIYLAGNSGNIDVFNAYNLSLIYTNSSVSVEAGSIKSTPILTNYYGDKVYLYFQGGNSPASLYVMEDDDSNNEAKDIEVLATPSVANYAMEQLAVDKDSSIYCYNESGYLYKFVYGTARLTSLEVEEATKDIEFSSNKLYYNIPTKVDLSGNIPLASSTATLKFKVEDGCTVSVKSGLTIDKELENGIYKALIPLTDGAGTAEITVSDNNGERVYNLTFYKASTDATLASLAVRGNSQITSSALKLTPSYNKDTFFYVAEKDSNSSSDYDTIWPVANNASSFIALESVSGVKGQINMGTTWDDSWMMHTFYSVYFADKNAKVNVKVIAENGNYNVYKVLLNKSSAGTGGGSGNTGDENITVNFTLKSHKETWLEKQVTVEQGSTVWEILGQVMKDEDLDFKVKNNFLTAVQIPGTSDYLEQLDEGEYSGWLYKVNDVSPLVGASELEANDGDDILWYYAVDYTKDDSSMGYSGGTSSSDNADLKIDSVKAFISGDMAKAEINKEDIESILNDILGDSSFEGNLEMEVELPSNLEEEINSLQIKIWIKVLKDIIENDDQIENLIISTNIGKLSLNKELISWLVELAEAGKVDYIALSLDEVDTDSLSSYKDLLSNSEAFRYNITVGVINIYTLDKGSIKVTIPYEFKAGENINNYNIYQLVENSLEKVNDISYDSLEKEISFNIDVLADIILTKANLVEDSNYIKEDSNNLNSTKTTNFKDIANHPNKDAILFVSKKGLFSGADDDNFEPDLEMTNAMLVTVLGKHCYANTNMANNFIDVDSEQYYSFYAIWALDKGVMKDLGNNMFFPNRAITKQNLGVILYRYLIFLGADLPVKNLNVDCKDLGNVDKDNLFAVQAMLKSGIMELNEDNSFEPNAIVTRGDCAAVLENMIKNVDFMF